MTQNMFEKKKRVAIKIGSSLQYPESQNFHLVKLERLVCKLCDFKNKGLDVCVL